MGSQGKNTIWTVVAFILVAAGGLAWMNVNDIRSLEDVYTYARGWSDKAVDCGQSGGPEGFLKCKYLEDEDSLSSGQNNNSEGNVSNETSAPTENGSAIIVDPKDIDKNVLSEKLGSLTLAEPLKVEYSRSDWKHWIGKPCNTRQDVLISQGENVEKDEKCKILSGVWIDPYSLNTFDNSSDLDIDHVIPLNYAAQMGGNGWDKEKKQEFANDKTQLLAVSAKENRKKGDKGPGKYMPPNKDFRCQYSQIWIDTAYKYSLSITSGDRAALEKGLKACG